jgi:hypothetical protein
MTATKLRYVLAGLIVVLLGGFGAGTWWVQGILAEKVRETEHAKIDAELSATEVQQLKQLDKQLEEQEDVVQRAKQIAASSAQYQYQDQVIQDVSNYAARYGIQVSTFDFSSKTTSSSTAGGAKKTPFTVTLKGPLSFVTYMRFLRDIEGNLTKIQVTSMTLAPDKDPNNITNPSLSCEVFLKS